MEFFRVLIHRDGKLIDERHFQDYEADSALVCFLDAKASDAKVTMIHVGEEYDGPYDDFDGSL